MDRYKLDQFSDDELDYYSRQIVMATHGLTAQKMLKDSVVAIVGLGGLGSPVAMQLASIGVGCLKIVDFDVVEISNLQRQHLYGVDQVGLPKVEAARKRLSLMNPYIEVKALPFPVNQNTVQDVIDGVDLVLGCLDAMTPRYILNRACIDRGVPFIHGAAITTNGVISTIIPGETACLECFQGGIDDDSLPTCSTVGVHPSIVNVVGSLMVSEAVRILTKKNPVLRNKFLFIDIEDLTFEQIKIKKAGTCSACGENREKLESLEHKPIIEICGREGNRVFVITPDVIQDLDLELVKNKIISNNLKILKSGELGISFHGNELVTGSILKSGVLILNGINDKDAALQLHEKLFK